jgi:hypothetical protein
MKILVLKFSLISILMLNVTSYIIAQEEGQKPEIKFTGYVKTDMFYDTRQNIAVREGHFLLFPENIKKDPDGKDLNAVSQFNMLSIQSRLGVTATGPEAFGAKTTGVIEGDFFGQLEANINLIRMRHAYMKLNWDKTELLIGQYWHALFFTSCFPDVVSFNTGAPIAPFARNPQVRLTQKVNNLKLIAVIQSQRDYANRNISNAASSSTLRNTAIPEFHVQAIYEKRNKETGNGFVTGVNAGYKEIIPQSTTFLGFKTSETVQAMSYAAFVNLRTSPLTIKCQAILGENANDYLFIGGFAVKDTIDATKGKVSFIPTQTVSYWTDIHTNGKKVQAGLFAGYTENLGTKSDIKGGVYGLATNISSLYRVAPRLVFISGKTKFALEGEYTAANYGKIYNKRAIPELNKEVSNLRILFAAYYSF